MADLAAAAGLQPDAPLLQNAAQMCSYLWDTAWSHAPGTIEGDADALHDMRVAIRRLRSALQNFEGMPEVVLVSPTVRREMKKQRRRAGRLGDALGAVRDYDVLDDYLKSYAKDRLKSEVAASPGLAHFEAFLMHEREAAFAPMVKRINRAAEPGRLRENVARWSRSLPGAYGPQISFREAAHLILPLRLDEVLSDGPLLQDAANEEGHHEVRKALRRLRYTLEIFAPCFAEPVKPHIKTLVQMQDVLGEMQDRSVLRETAHRAFESKADAKKSAKAKAAGELPTEASEAPWPEDVAAFIDYGTRRRRQLLGEIRKMWQAQTGAGFWVRLREL